MEVENDTAPYLFLRLEVSNIKCQGTKFVPSIRKSRDKAIFVFCKYCNFCIKKDLKQICILLAKRKF